MYEFIGVKDDIAVMDDFMKQKAKWLESDDTMKMSTKKTYWSHFLNKIHPVELALGKDLYTFSDTEIKNMIKNMATTSEYSKRSIFSCIDAYIRFTVNVGINPIGNPCDKLNLKDIIVVNESALKNEYQDLISFHNWLLGLDADPIEKVTLSLLRYGVRPEKALNLRDEDIDKERMCIYTTNKNNDRLELPIDNMFLMYVDKAKNCSTVNAPDVKKANGLIDYIEEGYIIKRSSLTQNRNNLQIHSMLRRLARNNGIRNISSKILNDCRLYDLVSEKIDKNHILKHSDLKKCIQILKGENVNLGVITTLKYKIEIIFGCTITNN